MADPLQQIEMKIAFLEQANAELSDVVYGQRREIDALLARIEALSARLDTGGQPSDQPYSLEEEKPPHY